MQIFDLTQYTSESLRAAFQRIFIFINVFLTAQQANIENVQVEHKNQIEKTKQNNEVLKLSGRSLVFGMIVKNCTKSVAE